MINFSAENLRMGRSHTPHPLRTLNWDLNRGEGLTHVTCARKELRSLLVKNRMGGDMLVVFHSCAKDGGLDRIGMMICEEQSWVPGAVSAVQSGGQTSEVMLI